MAMLQGDYVPDKKYRDYAPEKKHYVWDGKRLEKRKGERDYHGKWCNIKEIERHYRCKFIGINCDRTALECRFTAVQIIEFVVEFPTKSKSKYFFLTEDAIEEYMDTSKIFGVPVTEKGRAIGRCIEIQQSPNPEHFYVKLDGAVYGPFDPAVLAKRLVRYFKFDGCKALKILNANSGYGDLYVHGGDSQYR